MIELLSGIKEPFNKDGSGKLHVSKQSVSIWVDEDFFLEAQVLSEQLMLAFYFW